MSSLWQGGSIVPTSAHPSRHPAFPKPSSQIQPYLLQPLRPAAALLGVPLLLIPVVPSAAHGPGPVCRVQPRWAPAPGLAGTGCHRASTKPWQAGVAELPGEIRLSRPQLNTFQRQEEKPALGGTMRPPSCPSCHHRTLGEPVAGCQLLPAP